MTEDVLIHGTVASDVALLRSRITVQKCSLTVVGGPKKGASIGLNRETVHIGRDPWCDLVIERDSQVSGQHCEIEVGKDGLRLRDLNSRNGTFIDGVRIVEAHLSVGSKIQIGHTIIEVQGGGDTHALDIEYTDKSGKLVGRSPAMRKLFTMLERLGKRDVSVVFNGETGTGKTLIAEALHAQSHRQSGPFVVVNCGALPASLIEGALFGYEKGAFTGAQRAHAGYFEQAHGGTLFLDEIGEIPLELQPKLLTVLESHKVTRLGSTSEVATDFRLITATHKDLPLEIAEGRFREDLYYRLAPITVTVPPLRARREDMSLLVQRLLDVVAPGEDIRLTAHAIRKLEAYVWPGNLRQLRNALEQCIVFLDMPVIDAADLELPDAPRPPTNHSTSSPEDAPDRLTDEHVDVSLKGILARAEIAALKGALTRCEWNVQQAATHLDISLPWMYRRMKKYDLKRGNA